MKQNKVIMLPFLLLISSFTWAQTTYNYTMQYDVNGSRLKERTVVFYGLVGLLDDRFQC